jgi:hypothetical protein
MLSFSYLKEVDEETIWQYYKPALEFAMINENQQGNIDEVTKETLQRMRFKWMNSRLTNLEKAFENVSGAPIQAP